MTPTNDAPVTVEQVDRELYALIAPDMCSLILDGELDQHRELQAIARHRLAALASAPGQHSANDEVQKDEVTIAEREARRHGADSFGGKELASAPAGDGEILGYLHEHDAHEPVFSKHDLTTGDIQSGWRSTPIAAALARPRAATETVEFVREWLMSGDHPVSDWERQFAAAIDARPRAAVGEREALAAIAALLGNVDHSRPGGHGDALHRGGLLESIREIIDLALQSPPAKVEG